MKPSLQDAKRQTWQRLKNRLNELYPMVQEYERTKLQFEQLDYELALENKVVKIPLGESGLKKGEIRLRKQPTIEQIDRVKYILGIS